MAFRHDGLLMSKREHVSVEEDKECYSPGAYSATVSHSFLHEHGEHFVSD